MRTVTKTIYLSISQVIIKINFKKTNHLHYIKKKLIADVKKAFAGFIPKEIPKQTSVTIDIFEKKQLEGVSKGNKTKYYINYYTKLSDYKYVTSYYISISQLIIILQNIIFNPKINKDCLFLHASANNINNKAIIFTGKSGSGKSTAMKLLHKTFPSIADDSVIIKKINGTFYIFQTPFIEKEGWVLKTQQKFKLVTLFFLRKAKVYKTERIEDKEYIVRRLIKQIVSEKIVQKSQITLLLDFVNKFNEFYFLYFGKNDKKLTYFMQKIID